MTLSGDNIRDIAIALITLVQTAAVVAIPLLLRRARRIRDTVDVVDKKVSGVATTLDTVHALVNSSHAELKGELKHANEVTETALKMVVNREGMPNTDAHSGDDR